MKGRIDFDPANDGFGFDLEYGENWLEFKHDRVTVRMESELSFEDIGRQFIKDGIAIIDIGNCGVLYDGIQFDGDRIGIGFKPLPDGSGDGSPGVDPRPDETDPPEFDGMEGRRLGVAFGIFLILLGGLMSIFGGAGLAGFLVLLEGTILAGIMSQPRPEPDLIQEEIDALKKRLKELEKERRRRERRERRRGRLSTGQVVSEVNLYLE